MDTVKIFNAEGAVFDEREMSLTELPPIPDFAVQEITEAGGTTNGKPNVRIVSGLDPDIVEWVGGRFWRVYAFREHNPKEYAILHQPNGDKRILTMAEAAVFAKSPKLQGVVIPVKEDDIIEHGIPRYFVEYYKPPEYFGLESLWEEHRYIEDDDGKKVDLLGEFPSEGRYETWFAIEEAEEVDGQFTGRTTFREIDDVVVELIKAKIEAAKTSSAAEQHLQSRMEADEQMAQTEKKLREDIADVVAEHVDRIID